jgi:CubicO group peptidase (beta-lactamase class C family)
MKRLKKIFKWTAYTLLFLFLVGNLVIVVTGRFYIYKSIAYTFFRGYKQPSIYDLEVFEKREVPNGAPQPWVEFSGTEKLKLEDSERERIEELDPASFLVLWGDTVIYEEYWGEHDKAAYSNAFSMAKSVVSLLIGVALDEGKIKSLDEPVANYLPEFKGDKAGISIRHVLTMSTGLSWDESYVSPFSDVAELYYDTDARDLSLNRREIEEAPGKTFFYKSGDTQVLAYILEAAVGKSISEYASEKLWKKIGAESDAWWSLTDDENSTEKAFCCLYATSRDYLRLGKLINDKGNWKGEQLVSEGYMNEFCSLAPLVKRDGKPNNCYGFQNWIYTGETFAVTYFRGMRGQFLISIPEKDVVILRTGHSRDEKWVNTETEKNDALEEHNLELPDYIKIGVRLRDKAMSL